MYEKVENILKMAKESNTSVIAFICMDYVMARSVVYAAEAANTPAIVMLYPEHVTVQHTTGFRKFAAMVKELANEVKVPIGLHADHDYTYNNIMTTINAGFESVMMDGSMNDLDKNIELTKQVVLKAHELGVCVEGEIGHVGLASDSDNHNEDLYTKADAAEKFCKETGVNSLAVSIGNAHGEYKETPHLDIARLEEIHAATDVPLVLHGGSGIPDDQLLTAFSKGINKFNLGTEFLGKYYSAVADFSKENADNKDPVKIINMPAYVQAKLQPYLEERMKTLCHF
ncbi:6-phospho-5-dehydro-2-deoxy-D-gluconate aldolase [uncultured Roseburia sp.]|uniref:Class II fructose-bisphosphate aldolase n=1 Tax=Brotonthovivens ammoniilytica TaxID=2981725 RepID=A0ABT2TNJ6_9FIRM|nr:class II fructose-bisphosphate aldolase [Brotonthovivens ammoniilytica]MCU6763785.1 class II fructose-bisphosphate aldolase [Brotonthovivens ammoniilytica]SCJ35325.1 6-phospho-5-dehydro-2-deoxy-D-gluconate aldolase [uncultured Roseburia sp.]